MDVKRSVNTKVWMDSWFEELKPDEKLVWLYLLTNPTSNMLGIYEVSIKRISNDTGINQDRIKTILEGFERVRKAFYWFGSIVLPNWIKHQSMNTNMVTSARNLYNELSNEMKSKLLENGFESFESLSNGSGTLSKIEIEKESEIESEKEIEIEKKRGVVFSFSEVPDGFSEPIKTWLEYKKEKGQTYKSQKSFNALVATIQKLSNGNPSTAVKIVEQSMANNWAGLFELKQTQTSPPAQPTQPTKRQYTQSELLTMNAMI